MIMRKHVDHIFCNPDSQKVKVKLYLGQFEIKNISILHMNIYIYGRLLLSCAKVEHTSTSREFARVPMTLPGTAKTQ